MECWCRAQDGRSFSADCVAGGSIAAPANLAADAFLAPDCRIIRPDYCARAAARPGDAASHSITAAHPRPRCSLVSRSAADVLLRECICRRRDWKGEAVTSQQARRSPPRCRRVATPALGAQRSPSMPPTAHVVRYQYADDGLATSGDALEIMPPYAAAVRLTSNRGLPCARGLQGDPAPAARPRPARRTALPPKRSLIIVRRQSRSANPWSVARLRLPP